MRIADRSAFVRLRRSPTAALSCITLLCAVLLASVASAAGPATNSARYRFEGNRWLSLDLAVEEVRADVIRFEWPSTVLGFKSGYKATVKITNGSTRQASVGIAIAVYDAEARLVGAGSTGTRVGTLSPGDSAEFGIDFDSVTARLTTASQFHIALEIR
jgi:hypothetical protein